MKLTQHHWGVSMGGDRLMLRPFATVSWDGQRTLMETWSRSGGCSRDRDARQWRLFRGGVQVPDGEGACV